MEQYDYLIVGAGLFGCIFAHEMKKDGKKCLVIDKRPHIAGNTFTQNISGIDVHKYGPHIFHTSNQNVWNYINQFADFNNFRNSPVATINKRLYSLPFNMNTFYQVFGSISPTEAMNKIENEILSSPPLDLTTLEGKAISMVGRTIYELLIKGYTEKQWGKKCSELPSSIITRLPLRFTFDNNYFSDKFQGIPVGGYSQIAAKMLDGIEVMLNTDFIANRNELSAKAKRIVYTGAIDEFYDYKHGELEYRSLLFEQMEYNKVNYQGVAVMNFTDAKVKHTRIIEHKHFTFGTQPTTILTYEYPAPYKKGAERYYPISDAKNMEIYKKYRSEANNETNVIFGGRLAEYKYYDMDKVIESALHATQKEISRVENIAQ